MGLKELLHLRKTVKLCHKSTYSTEDELIVLHELHDSSEKEQAQMSE